LIRARLCLWNDATPFVTKLVSVAVPLTKMLEGVYWQGVDIVVLNHRHLSNIDCSSFVMCPLLAQLKDRLLFFLFLLRPFTVQMMQTRQAVCTVKQSIISRCLCIELTIVLNDSDSTMVVELSPHHHKVKFYKSAAVSEILAMRDIK